MMVDFWFGITTTPFDEDYEPSARSRITTNFANLARGAHRRQNLRRALTMIDRRCNDLASWDNADGDRYTVEIRIISVHLRFSSADPDQDFPLLEMLDVGILDRQTGQRHQGIVGNSFSSYIRDFDFSVLLPALRDGREGSSVPDDFGDLHGRLFRHFVDSDAYRERYAMPPVICISVSTSRTYRRTANRHPVLGVEYRQDEQSLTDLYFAKMGLGVRHFMPRGAVAPLAFYFRGDLLNDYSSLQLIGTISTMEAFQKIYRPEIYNANSAAADVYTPSLTRHDYTRTQIDYDRDERSLLAVTQGRYAEEHLMKPHGHLLEQWVADVPASIDGAAKASRP